MEVDIRPDPHPPVLLALSGGGAKGLGHIGVLKAIEDAGIQVIGHAGTSAGAIVAALAAAGYRADELVDIRSGRTLFESRPSLAGRRPIDLIKGWKRLSVARAILGQLAKRWVRSSVAFCAAIAVTASLAVDMFEWLMLGGILAVIALVSATLRGLASIEPLRQELAGMLESKLGMPDPTFADLALNGATPLKVVAANLSTRELELFSSETTPTTSVARAVMASASIPMAFCLPTIYMDRTLDRGRDGTRVSEHDRFCDGGIVSNLPAWLWDEERALKPTALTVAVDISSEGKHRSVGARGWFAPLLSTALFGSSELNLRATGRIERIRLASDLGLMDFDASREKVLEQVRSANAASSFQIARAIIEAPELLTNACNIIRQAAEDYLASSYPLRHDSPPYVERVGFLGIERGLARSLRLEYAAGFNLRPGERPVIALDAGAVAAAWTTGAFCLDRGATAFLNDPPYLRSPRTIWRLATPLRDELGRRVGILVIDGTCPIDDMAAPQVSSDLVKIVDSYLAAKVLSILTTQEAQYGSQA